jgi:hypothetical protein
MKELSLKEKLLLVSDTYCKAVELSDARVSTLLFNAGRKIFFLKNGTDLSTGNWERAMQWFSDRWPARTKWPTNVKRPRARKLVAAE